jgi:hypothetical protein
MHEVFIPFDVPQVHGTPADLFDAPVNISPLQPSEAHAISNKSFKFRLSSISLYGPSIAH